jgi:hypothetical protein
MKRTTLQRLVRVGFSCYLLWKVDQINTAMIKKQYGIK